MWRASKHGCYAYGVCMDILSYINTPLDAEPMLIEQGLEQWRALRESARLVNRSQIRVLRPVRTALRVLVRRAVVRLHAARCDLGDSAAQLMIRLSSQRPIGIHPVGRFVFGNPYQLEQRQW